MVRFLTISCLMFLVLDCQPFRWKYFLAGSVSGLAPGGTLVLVNGAETLTISQNGTFQFAAALDDGANFTVSVQSAPAPNSCTVENGSGKINRDDFKSVNVRCIGTFYTFFPGVSANYIWTAQASDGGYFIGGTTNVNTTTFNGVSPKNGFGGGNDMMVVKYDAYGNFLWYTYMGGLPNETMWKLTATNDGGCIALGVATGTTAIIQGVAPIYAFTGGAQDPIAFKLSAAGDVEWWSFYGTNAFNAEEVRGINQTADGGYLFVALSDAIGTTLGGVGGVLRGYTGPNWDNLVVKLTSTGGVQWWTFLGGGGGQYRPTADGVQVSDGGYVIATTAAASMSPLNGQIPIVAYSGGAGDIVIYKLDASGAFLWYTNIGGPAGVGAVSMQKTSDGGVVGCGGTSGSVPAIQGQSLINPYVGPLGDAYMFKLDASGNLQWHTTYGGANGQSCWTIRQARDGGFFVGGFSAAGAFGPLNGINPYLNYGAANDVIYYGKFSSSGSLLWYNFIGQGVGDAGFSLDATADGGVLVSGYLAGNYPNLFGKTPLNAYAGGTNFILMKFNADGKF